jgi:hypothetical protein
MKKIVRKNHLRENFRANLIMETGFVNQDQGIEKKVNENIMGNLKRFLVKGRNSLKRLNQLQIKDILGKERPETGFTDRIQGIDPNRSGELRRSAGFWDTEVGRRLLYGKSGGGLVAPPTSMFEGKVYAQLQEMVKKSISSKEINNILVTQDMAKNIVNLHEALNTDNKKILEKNIQSKDGFFEVLDFSVRN